jgi:hypothetical protein
MHGFLSRDGMPPAGPLAQGPDEVFGYGVELVNDEMLDIEPGFVVRQCFPLNRRGLKCRGAATGRYGLAAWAWSLAQVSLRPRVRLKTSRPGVESGSGQK